LISLARYSALLAQPTLRNSIASSFLGRLPIGITGLAILMFAQSATGSFARGGTVAACYTIGLAALAPALGRVIDRYGPRQLLLASAFAFPAALLALVLALRSDGPIWIAGLLAGAAGACFPPITVCMRTFLKQRLKDDAQLAAAYSLESVLIETIFIVGPLLVALFVALVSPAAAVLFAAACGFAGTLLFRASRALAEWRIEPRRAASVFGPLAERGFVPLLAVVLCYASAFGLVEIGTMAYAAELGRPAFAGVLLGVMSVSSAAGGLVYGSRSWGLPLARQFPRALVVMGLCIAPLAFFSNDWAFALWCLPAGLAMSPALIMQAMLVAKLSRPEQSTEAFTWSATALLTGVGAGLTLGGVLLESARSPAALGVAALISLAAGALALKLVRLPASG
jgi:predicted MFS family arabinose efflux permease